MRRPSRSVVCLFIALCCQAAVPAMADSARAECKLVAEGQAEPTESDACTFSQRQGYVRVAIDGGPEYAFAPEGDAPGNYRDQDGEVVWRKSGLGEAGVIFQMKGERLLVYWVGTRWSCTGQQVLAEKGCELSTSSSSVSFKVRSSGSGSINTLTTTPLGLAVDNSPISQEIDGTVSAAEVADLDGDGWPEVYIYVNSAGSGSYGSLVAYAVNKGKSMSSVYLPPVAENPEAARGYMGHDEFAVVENRLVRRFPVYLPGDSNAEPGGGTRQLQYKLTPGEAGWVLQVDRVVEY